MKLVHGPLGWDTHRANEQGSLNPSVESPADPMRMWDHFTESYPAFQIQKNILIRTERHVGMVAAPAFLDALGS